MFNNYVMAPWELLQKQMIWQQLSFFHHIILQKKTER